jgi:DNA polymerase-1
MKLLFDIETNGYLEVTDRIHSLVCIDVETEELFSFADQTGYQPISTGIEMLKEAEELSGHNLLGFDLQVFQKLRLLDINLNDDRIFDTLVASRLIYAHIETLDWERRYKDMPIKLYGRHSLESWGYRLGEHKGDFGKQNDWSRWTKEMQDYCEQDVLVNFKLYNRLKEANYPEKSLRLEHKFAAVLEKQMTQGVHFDHKKASALVKDIEPKLEETKKQLKAIVPPFKTYTTFTPKRDNRTLGYKKDVPIARELVTEFNPGSRPQIVKHLKRAYGWQPVDFTDKMNPKVDRDVLGKLTHWPEVPLILDYLDMAKLMGMLMSGEQSWLTHFRDGRLYGRIIHNGAITGRCTHFNPNLGQIPSTRSFMGGECRELFYAPQGYRFVGCDVKGLELRMLGHYLSKYDNGDYGREVVEGDVHTLNQQAAELPTRDDAKTFIYAYLYGAGDAKLGSIVEPEASEARQKQIGSQLRRKFELRISSLRELGRDVKQKVKATKKLRGLDGRLLFPRGQHMALNTLLQGAGAVVVKMATVLADEMILEAGLDTHQVLHVHDEFQFICKEGQEEQLTEILLDSVRLAGEQLEVRLPLSGDCKIGMNWRETH